MIKNLPAMPETQVQSLDWEDPLQKGVVTHSSILAWRIPWTEKPDGLQSMVSQRVGHDWATNTFTLKKKSKYIHLELAFNLQCFVITNQENEKKYK